MRIQINDYVNTNDYANTNNSLKDVYLKNLKKLIGLNNVKDEVNKLVDYLVFCDKVKDTAKLDKVNFNMVFTGNPGTGKTTVAKIISGILNSLGYTERFIFAETTPRDFIAEYVGQTAIKTKKLIDTYKGGVIFIDEAYGFFSNNDEKSFAPEALIEIIKEMEKKETIFIFSGYKKEMEQFLEMNPGMNSRIGYTIDFKDYEEDELLKMFLIKMKNSGFDMELDAIEKTKEIINKRRNEKNFGNGRMIDNLYNEVLREHAKINKDEHDINELMMIKVNSINNINTKEKGGKYFG